MRLYHATPAHNLQSIMAEGLDPQYAVTGCDRKFVWLHSPRLTDWAVRHTSRRKDVPQEEVVVFEVSIPRAWLVRAWPGIWKTADLIPPYKLEVLD